MAIDGSLNFDVKVNTDNTKKELRKAREELYSLTQEINAQKKIIKETKKVVCDLSKAYEEWGTEELAKKHKDAADELDIAKKELVDMQLKAKGLKDRIKELGHSSIDTAKDIEKAREEFYSLTQEINAQKKIIKEIEEVVCDWSKTYEEWGGKKVAKKHKDVADELDIAKKELVDMQVKAEGLKDRIKELGHSSINTAKNVEKMGESAQKASNNFSKIASRIGELIKYTFIFSVMSKALCTVRNRAAETLPEFKQIDAIFNGLGDKIVQTAAPLIQVLVPAFQAVASAILYVVNTIAQSINAIASLFGTEIFSGDKAQSINKESKAVGGLGKAIKGAGKASKAANKDMASFDTIVKLGDKSKADAIKGAAGGIAAAGKNAKAAIPELGDFGKLLTDIGTSIAGLVTDSKILGLYNIITGITGAVKNAKDIWKNGLDWNKLAENAVNTFKILSGAYTLGGVKGLTVASLINGIKDSVLAAHDIFENGLNWENLALNALGSIQTIGSAALAGGAKGAGVAAIINGIVDAVENAVDIFENGLDWQNLALNAKSAIGTIGGALLVGGKKGASIAAIINGIADSVTAHYDIFNKGLDWQNLALNAKSAIGIIGGALLSGDAKWKRFAGIAAIISSIGDAVAETQDYYKNGLSWKNIALGAEKSIKAIGGAYLVGGQKGVTIAGIILGITDSLRAAQDIFKNGLNWKNLTTGLKGFIALANSFRNIFIGKGLTKGIATLVGAGAAVGALAVLWALNDLFNDFKTNASVWQKALHTIELAVTGLGTAFVLINASQPFGWVMIGIGLIIKLVEVIVKNWKKIKEWAKKAWEKIKEWGKTLWDSIFGWIGELGKGITKWFSGLWDGLAEWFSEWWKKSWIKKIIDTIAGFFSKKHTVNISKKEVNSPIDTGPANNLLAPDNYTDLFSNKLSEPILKVQPEDLLVEIFNNAEKYKKVIDELKAYILSMIDEVIAATSEKMNALLETVGTTLTTVQETLTEKIEAVKELIGSTLETIQGAISEKIEPMKENLSSVFAEIAEGFSAMCDTNQEKYETTIENINKTNDMAFKMKPLKNFEFLLKNFEKLCNNIKQRWSSLVSAIEDDLNSISHATRKIGGFRLPAMANVANVPLTTSIVASGSIMPLNSLSQPLSANSSTRNDSVLQGLVDTFKQAVAQRNNSQNTAVLQIDGQAFGKIVYQYNQKEQSRIGVDLLSIG